MNGGAWVPQNVPDWVPTNVPSRQDVYDAALQAKRLFGNISIGKLCGTLGEDDEEETNA